MTVSLCQPMPTIKKLKTKKITQVVKKSPLTRYREWHGDFTASSQSNHTSQLIEAPRVLLPVDISLESNLLLLLSLLGREVNQVTRGRHDLLLVNGQSDLKIEPLSVLQDLGNDMSTGRGVEVGDDFETSGDRVGVDEEEARDLDVSAGDELDVDLGVVGVADDLADVDVGGDLEAAGGGSDEVQL